MMTHTLAVGLNKHAESVSRWLLPHGTRQGPAWVAGSWAGEQGQSIRIVVVGKDVGHWRDQRAGGDHGFNLIEVAARVLGVDEATAAIEVAAFLEKLAQQTKASTSTTSDDPARDIADQPQAALAEPTVADPAVDPAPVIAQADGAPVAEPGGPDATHDPAPVIARPESAPTATPPVVRPDDPPARVTPKSAKPTSRRMTQSASAGRSTIHRADESLFAFMTTI